MIDGCFVWGSKAPVEMEMMPKGGEVWGNAIWASQSLGTLSVVNARLCVTLLIFLLAVAHNMQTWL